MIDVRYFTVRVYNCSIYIGLVALREILLKMGSWPSNFKGCTIFMIKLIQAILTNITMGFQLNGVVFHGSGI